jgi:branched-subunit amino acid permease
MPESDAPGEGALSTQPRGVLVVAFQAALFVIAGPVFCVPLSGAVSFAFRARRETINAATNWLPAP